MHQFMDREILAVGCWLIEYRIESRISSNNRESHIEIFGFENKFEQGVLDHVHPNMLPVSRSCFSKFK